MFARISNYATKHPFAVAGGLVFTEMTRQFWKMSDNQIYNPDSPRYIPKPGEPVRKNYNDENKFNEDLTKYYKRKEPEIREIQYRSKYKSEISKYEWRKMSRKEKHTATYNDKMRRRGCDKRW